MLQMIGAVVLGLIAYKLLRVALYFVIGLVSGLIGINKMKKEAGMSRDPKHTEV